MTFLQWLRSPFAPRPTPARRRLPDCRPAVERLEDRLTPSTGGLLDPTFGSGGTVTTTPVTSGGWGIHTDGGAGIAQPDGKVIVVGRTYNDTSVHTGYIDLVRYTPNGTLDTGFGSGGVVTTKFGSRVTATGLALDPTTGKIIVAGGESGGLHLVRYNTNGTLDKTFNGKGDVLLAASQGGFEPAGVVVESVGGAPRYLAFGGAPTGGPNYNTAWAMARFNADGTLDTTFGNGGKVVDDMSPAINENDDAIRGVAFRPDGTLVAVGTIATPFQTPNGVADYPELVLAHYDTAGRRDPNFGSGGTAVILDGTHAEGLALALRPDGKIIVGGNARPEGHAAPDALLARFNADGSLDTTFPGGGYFTTHLDDPSSYDNFNAVTLQSDGSIVLGAFTSGSGPFLLRYHGDGTPDTGFGSGGRVSLPFYTGGENGVMLLSDGRMVVTGAVNNALGAARYLASAPQIGSFTASSNPVMSGSSLTLTASNITDGNPNSTVTQVAFYAQVNGSNTLLGYGTQTSPGVWTFTFTISLAPGNYTLFAQAEDNFGAFGDLAALSLQVL
jgi:uncharacterized delta-60 repeat protein